MSNPKKKSACNGVAWQCRSINCRTLMRCLDGKAGASSPPPIETEETGGYERSEPVAWQYLLPNGKWSNMPGDWTIDEGLPQYTYRPLYAHPRSSPPPKGGDEDNSVAAGAAPRTPAAEAIVEVMARAICLSHGEHPDSDAPVSHICGPNNEVQPWWEFYREQAEAALTALQASGMAVVPTDALRDEARACWDMINTLIVPGDLPGIGTDKASMRNGLILAANAIFDRAYWDRAISPDGKSERPPASAEPSSASEKQPQKERSDE